MIPINLYKESKPKTGVILLRAEWFDSVVALPELAKDVEKDAQLIREQLEKQLDITDLWIVNSIAALNKTQNDLRKNELDLVILMFQVWAEDYFIQPLLNAIGKTPLAIWCYQPWQELPSHLSFNEVLRGSGLVGTFEGLGTLQNLNTAYFFTWGSPQQERPLNELFQFAQAAKVKKRLQAARIGLLPYRNEQMQSTFVDEFRLRTQLGPSIEYLSVGDLIQTAQAISPAETQAYVNYLKNHYPIKNVSEATLLKSAQVSLGLAHLAISHQLDVLSFNDIAEETHKAFGLRPCLYPPILLEKNIAIALEGDLGAATAVFILKELSFSPIFFVEFWMWDEKENILIGGHAGPQNPQNANPEQIWISHDYEYAQTDSTEGAHLQFITKEGPVTLFQIRSTPSGWQAIAFKGVSLGGEPRLEGYPHAIIRPDVSLYQFFRQCAEVGTTQHFAMTYGDALKEIEHLSKLLNINLKVIH
ncbi:MAG: hypothetical protein ACPL3P_07920 [Anaerolineales bacterium]